MRERERGDENKNKNKRSLVIPFCLKSYFGIFSCLFMEDDRLAHRVDLPRPCSLQKPSECQQRSAASTLGLGDLTKVLFVFLYDSLIGLDNCDLIYFATY